MRSPVLSPLQFQWMLVAFAATLAAHMLWLPFWYSALLGGVVLARWLQRRSYARAWPGWIKFPLLVAIIAMVVVEYGVPSARQSGTAALTGFCALKLIESERRRDGLMIMTVCLFLISVQFLFNQGILISMYMALPTLLVFLALNEVSAPPGTQGGLVSRLGSITRELLPLLAVTLPMTIFLFLSVPRLNQPLWGNPSGASESRTGMSDEMSPGSITELLADDTPAMRITFDGPIPPKASLYWRGPVLWTFDRITWRSARELQQIREHGRLVGPQPGGSRDQRYHVMLEPTDRRWLFLLDMATGFPAGSQRLADGQVVRDRPVSSLYAFDAASDLDASLSPSPRLRDDESAGLQRKSLSDNPRTSALAETWIAELGHDRQALVNRALQYFRNEPFRYSLSPPPLTSAHRIDEFLFDTRTGFCEHYASSFTMLMRAAGVPARVVTGYQGGDYNRIGGYLLVRNSDAHAWSEVLLPGRGWVRVDPTAAVSPDRVELGAAAAGGSDWANSAWLQGLRERYDALQAWWNRTMVQFDATSQQNFFDKLGIDPSDWRQAAAWMGFGIGLVAVLTGLLFFRSLAGTSSDPVARAWRRFIRRLRKAGIQRGASEGPLDFGRRAATLKPQWADAIVAVSEAYALARYAPSEPIFAENLRQHVQAFLELAKRLNSR